MLYLRRKPGASFQLLLIAALLMAQIGMFAHALEHELGTFQDQLCATCLTTQSIDSPCVAGSIGVQTDAIRVGVELRPTVMPASRAVPRARQRSPPETL